MRGGNGLFEQLRHATIKLVGRVGRKERFQILLIYIVGRSIGCLRRGV
jgi:hypothetical protein